MTNLPFSQLAEFNARPNGWFSTTHDTPLRGVQMNLRQHLHSKMKLPPISRTVYRRIIVLSVIAILAWLIYSATLELYSAYEGKRTYSQLGAFEITLSDYIESEGRLPGVDTGQLDNEENASWRSDLEEYNIYDLPLDTMPIFPLVYDGCVWEQQLSSVELADQNGQQILMIYFDDLPDSKKWKESTVVFLANDRLSLRGQEHIHLDPRGAHVIRLGGHIERIPDDLDLKTIMKWLRTSHSFVN